MKILSFYQGVAPNNYLRIEDLSSYDPKNAPSKRYGHTLTVLQTCDMYVFGGALLPEESETKMNKTNKVDEVVQIVNEIYCFDYSRYPSAHEAEVDHFSFATFNSKFIILILF